jgi:hypothetical protein
MRSGFTRTLLQYYEYVRLKKAANDQNLRPGDNRGKPFARMPRVD